MKKEIKKGFVYPTIHLDLHILVKQDSEKVYEFKEFEIDPFDKISFQGFMNRLMFIAKDIKGKGKTNPNKALGGR